MDPVFIKITGYWAEFEPSRVSPHVTLKSPRMDRWVNMLHIEEVRDLPPRVVKEEGEPDQEIAQFAILDHHQAYGSYHARAFHSDAFVVDGTAAEFMARYEQAVQDARSVCPPEPVRIGSGGSENNLAVATIVVADIDLYPVLRFSGRSGSTAAKALLSNAFSVDVQTSVIGVANTPLPSKSGHLVGPSGTVYVSRSKDGTRLYLLGEDSAAAFGVTVEGVPS